MTLTGMTSFLKEMFLKTTIYSKPFVHNSMDKGSLWNCFMVILYQE